jgi:peptidoglycan/LPS O-acetylase OafA/YrhL
MLNLFALLVLVLHYAPWLRRKLPPLLALQTMGRASLQVFVAHLALALLLLAWLGEADERRTWTQDALVLGASLLALYLVALLVDRIERRSAAARQRLRRSTAQLVKAGAQRSRDAIRRIRPR